MAIRRRETITRADRLRRKRESRTQAAAFSAGSHAPRNVYEIRPRGTAAAARRLYSIPLDQPGVEVQIPAVTISFSPRALAGILAGIASLAMFFLLTSPSFQVSALAVRGLGYLSADSVAAAANLEGANFFLLSPAEVERGILRRIPSVRGAMVSVDFAGKVTVEVQEREPILLWVQDGKTYWVDGEGVIFPVMADTPGLVQVDVVAGGPAVSFDGLAGIDPDLVVQAMEIRLAFPDGTEIIYDGRHGLGIVDANGWTVYFGFSGQIPEKIDCYLRLADDLNSRGIRPAMISLEDLRHPYYHR